jgi:TPR repeat protein
VVKDLVEAARLYKLAAESGSAIAQYNLGLCCNDGVGVEQAHAAAARWFRAAADQGFAAAQYSLGVVYVLAAHPLHAIFWLEASQRGIRAAPARRLSLSHMRSSHILDPYQCPSSFLTVVRFSLYRTPNE